jgi:hypothetical protein
MKQITTLGLESKVDLHTAEKLTYSEPRNVALQNVLRIHNTISNEI